MAKSARSIRGQDVNFDILTIKRQLAAAPITVGVNQRRRFIDEKDGIKTREFIKTTPMPQVQQPIPQPIPQPTELPSALMVAAEGVRESAKAAKTEPKVKSEE